LAIVYIQPIYNEYKLPPLETYEIEYEAETANEINVPSSLLRFAHKTPKNRLKGDFLPYKLPKHAR
jgi:hypothetical protein